MNAKIFREYDIRGVWGKDLTAETAELIGKGFGTSVRARTGKERVTLSVGRDVRLHSGTLSQSLIKGLVSTGARVIGIGECPTPAQYFSLFHLDTDGGVMVTGSHNPPEYNGFKLTAGRETISGDDIRQILEIILSGRFDSGSGSAETYPLVDAYAAHLRNSFSDLSGIRVVLDAGNGTAGLVAPGVIRALGAEVIELFCEPDGSFPNHHPDPVVPENLGPLIAEVKRSGAHLGIAYDGDSDRIGVVDGDGEIVWGDGLMVIFSRDILSRHPGAAVIGEVKCSQVMYDDIRLHGGRPIMWKTGHSLIKKKMKEEGALLAGEMSGHIFFADRYFGYDDAIYASLRLLEILREHGRPYGLKRLLGGLPPVFATPEIRVDCDDVLKFSVAGRIRDAFPGHEVNTIDGARILFEGGWALVRASNTQPALVTRFEAQTEERLREIRTLVEGKLEAILGEGEPLS